LAVRHWHLTSLLNISIHVNNMWHWHPINLLNISIHVNNLVSKYVFQYFCTNEPLLKGDALDKKQLLFYFLLFMCMEDKIQFFRPPTLYRTKNCKKKNYFQIFFFKQVKMKYIDIREKNSLLSTRCVKVDYQSLQRVTQR
jgi:hypothetical protein